MSKNVQAEPGNDDAWIREAKAIAAAIRLRGFEHVMAANGGYLSQICSAAEMLAYLYSHGLNLAPPEAPLKPSAFTGTPRAGAGYETGARFNGESAPDRDRFFFSPAHYALPLYVALIETGRMHPDGLSEFNKDGSTVELIGAEHSPGFETTTGSLSQALSQAAGVAIARRMKGEAGLIWVMMSDGEYQEGQTWEAFQAIAFHRLDNMRVIVDVNEQQCDGPMELVMKIEPLAERLRAFGATVVEIDGHDLAAMDAATTRAEPGKALVILARTDPARGVPLLNERCRMLHYLRFTSAEEKNRYEAELAAMRERSSC